MEDPEEEAMAPFEAAAKGATRRAATATAGADNYVAQCATYLPDRRGAASLGERTRTHEELKRLPLQPATHGSQTLVHQATLRTSRTGCAACPHLPR